MRTERGSRPDDRAQIPRIGHPVDGHDQRRPAGVAGAPEQIVRVRVLIRRVPRQGERRDGPLGR